MLLFTEELLPLLLDNTHLGLESFFCGVGYYLILFGVTTTIKKLFEGSFTLSNMQLVEDSLQVVYLVFLWSLVAMSNLTLAILDLLLGGILLALVGLGDL